MSKGFNPTCASGFEAFKDHGVGVGGGVGAVGGGADSPGEDGDSCGAQALGRGHGEGCAFVGSEGAGEVVEIGEVAQVGGAGRGEFVVPPVVAGVCAI